MSMLNCTHTFISTKIHELLYVLLLSFNCVSIRAVTGLMRLHPYEAPRPRSKPPSAPNSAALPFLHSLCRHSFSFILFLVASLIIKQSKLFSLSSRSHLTCAARRLVQPGLAITDTHDEIHLW